MVFPRLFFTPTLTLPRQGGGNLSVSGWALDRDCSIIQLEHAHKHCLIWIPAFAGMTTTYILTSFPRRRESREQEGNSPRIIGGNHLWGGTISI
jgi:hypothetical protein